MMGSSQRSASAFSSAANSGSVLPSGTLMVENSMQSKPISLAFAMTSICCICFALTRRLKLYELTPMSMARVPFCCLGMGWVTMSRVSVSGQENGMGGQALKRLA